MSAKIALLIASVTALVLAAGTAAAPPTPGSGQVTAGTGCSVQCVVKALVTATASYANVAIETSVPTRTVVTARRPTAQSPDASSTSSSLATHRTVFLPGLEPDTTYSIVLKATDAQGRTDVRTGVFKTRAVETAVDPGVDTITSNVGCSIQCVRKALFTQVGGTDATIEIATGEPATLQVMLSRDAPIQESWGPRFSFVDRSISSPGLVKTWTGHLDQLRPGTTYHVIVSATDGRGRSAYRTGTVRMDDRKVRITLLKIKVIDDADKGSNRGEISFEHRLGGNVVAAAGFHKISSGDTVDVRGDSGRPGALAVVTANGSDPVLKLVTDGLECDWQQMKNCVRESGWAPGSGGGETGGKGDDWAVAGGTFHLNSLLESGALPSTFGMGLPAGHDAYFAYATTSHYLKFRVYGYLDVFFE